MSAALQNQILEDLAICVKDVNGKVISQNPTCKEICGHQVSSVCEKGCMKLFSVNQTCGALNEGAQVFNNTSFSGNLYDVIILGCERRITTLLYPLQKKHERELEFLRKFGLSRREYEIIELVVRGLTNTEISRDLHISRATLKTHLNNIYRKLPDKVAAEFKRKGSVARSVPE